MKKLRHSYGPFNLNESPNDYAGKFIQNNERVIGETVIRDSVKATAEEEGNACLLGLSPTAPHHCADALCPGDVNRRRLEAYDGLVKVGKQLRDALAKGDPQYSMNAEEGNALNALGNAIKKAEAIK